MTQDITEKFGSDPYALFNQWLSEAEKTEINDPNAMALSVIDEQGRPSVRMVLLKGVDERGFVLYTNYNSRKGKGLRANPYAELMFHWKTLEKQIRIHGPVEQVSDAEADAYFNSRHRESRIGAWASQQSQPMDDPDDLRKREEEYRQKFEGSDTIPRPEHWSGFRIKPEQIEFWIAGKYRLHTRFVYTKTKGNNWDSHWLNP